MTIEQVETIKPYAVTMDHAAIISGMSKAYLWIAVKDGRLPIARIGRSVRVRVADLQKFIDDQMVAQ